MFVQPASKDSSGDEAPSPQEGLSAQVVARNLVNLVNESKAGELASLEEVISSLVKDNLDPDKDAPLDPEVNMALTQMGASCCAWTGWGYLRRFFYSGFSVECLLDSWIDLAFELDCV